MASRAQGKVFDGNSGITFYFSSKIYAEAPHLNCLIEAQHIFLLISLEIIPNYHQKSRLSAALDMIRFC